MVLKRFNSCIDFGKLIKYAVDETGLGKAQLKSERKGLALGRMLILSSILESGAFHISKKTNRESMIDLIGSFFFEIAKLWNQQSVFRESLTKIIEKGISVLSKSDSKYVAKMLSILGQYILLKPTTEQSETLAIINTQFSSDANYLSLFIIVKDTLPSLPEAVRKSEYLSSVDGWTLKSNYKTVFGQMKKMLIDEPIVNAFPRPHSCMRHLVRHLESINSSKCIQLLWKKVFEEYCFNESQLYSEDVNKRAKISLNSIGFYVFQYFMETSIGPKIILDLLTPNFIRMWVNRMNKRRTHKLDSVIELDQKFKAWMEKNSKNFEDTVKLQLLKKLFGPNANRRFTFKSNLSLFVSIAQDMSEETIHEYISYAEDMFKTPDLKEFYNDNEEVESVSEEDEEEKQKLQSNKEDNIKIFLLNMIVNTVMIFKNHSTTTLKEVINFIVYQAFFNENLTDRMKEFAKDKLFALVDNLHKRQNVPSQKDDLTHNFGLSFTNAFLESKSLWISEVNKTIGRYAAEGNEFNTLDLVDTNKKPQKIVEKARDNKHKQKIGNSFY
jgi:hypothetical protein